MDARYLCSCIILILILPSCVDLSVDNLNQPDSEIIFESGGAYLESYLVEASNTLFFETLLDVTGVNMAIQADQVTRASNYNGFLDFNIQPRIPYNNHASSDYAHVFYVPWVNLNSVIAKSNLVLKGIRDDNYTVRIDGVDITSKLETNALFLRGIAYGYLGLIYDRSFLYTETIEQSNLELSSYSDLIQTSINNISDAIRVAENSPNYSFDIVANEEYNLNEFKAIANSFMARILAGSARNSQQAANINWNQVLAFANQGLGQSGAADGGQLKNFSPESIAYEFYNEASDWMGYLTSRGSTLSSGLGYLPVDVKVTHMLDKTYPVDFPDDGFGGPVQYAPPAVSEDQRINYFLYVPSHKFFTRRDNYFYSNYFNLRMFADNNWQLSGYPTVLFTAAEVNYLRAEAHIMGAGTFEQAATILNTETPFGTVPQDFTPDLPSVQLGYLLTDGLAGNNTILGDASLQEFQLALLKEYSVELHGLGGMGLQWFFMRRHDLLQKGTGLQYPVPGHVLDSLSIANYTFGGAEFTNEGTATGANSWKTLVDRINSPKKKKRTLYQAHSASDFTGLFQIIWVSPEPTNKNN